MSGARRHPLIAGARINSLGTLVSRVLGLLRDMATASLLGMSKGGVADAFWFAFRIPNLFRQLFGEGAMTASYLPVLTVELERDPAKARRLASVVLALLAMVLACVVAVGELLLGAVWWVWGDVVGVPLLVGLSAVMLPYLMLICLAAQLTAMLQASLRFTVPALAPALLNIVWLVAAWGVAPWFTPNEIAQAYVLAVGVLVAGAAQVAVQVPTLRRLGFRFEYDWAAARDGVVQILRNMAPMMLGLAVTQINALGDSLVAWGLASASNGPQTIAWLGDVPYPMRQGAVAALYFGDRLCEFPVGLVGAAVAAAIFPLLSRHAARNDQEQLGGDLTLGLRLVLCLSIPAGVGLFLLARPITQLFFQHGQFLPEDTARAARMIAWYGTGVWAYCASAVIVRGYYALNDFHTPVRVAAGMVGLNLASDLALIWPLAEAGLAISTSISAGLQVVLLMAIFSRRQAPLRWRPLAATVWRAVAATCIMAVVVHVALARMPDGGRWTVQAIRLGVPLTLGMAAYVAAHLLLGGRELGMLWRGEMVD